MNKIDSKTLNHVVNAAIEASTLASAALLLEEVDSEHVDMQMIKGLILKISNEVDRITENINKVRN